MPSLYVVLYQFGSATNARNFVNSNTGIDASLVTVTTAAGIAEGTWVAAFPENLNQLPGGFTTQFIYNGNNQMMVSWNPGLDISTISIFVIPDSTPVFYRGLPVTNLANGPAAGVTGSWRDGGWNVQYIYPPGRTLTLQFVVQPSVDSGMFTVSTGLTTGVGVYNIPQLGLNNFLILLSGSTRQESDVGVLVSGNSSAGLINNATWSTESGESWGTSVLNFAGWIATDTRNGDVWNPEVITSTGDYHDFLYIVGVEYTFVSGP